MSMYIDVGGLHAGAEGVRIWGVGEGQGEAPGDGTGERYGECSGELVGEEYGVSECGLAGRCV